jgi:hypothetical protein
MRCILPQESQQLRILVLDPLTPRGRFEILLPERDNPHGQVAAHVAQRSDKNLKLEFCFLIGKQYYLVDFRSPEILPGHLWLFRCT